MTGCHTLINQAEELHKKGAFLEAIDLYEKALEEEPGNLRALAGLKNSKQGFISQKLIEVRKMRAAANTRGSLDLLNLVIKKQNEWQLFPEGPVTSTMKDEVAKSFPAFKQRVEGALAQELPLKAEYFLVHYDRIFTGASYQSELGPLKDRAFKKGQVLCKKWQSNADKWQSLPYMSLFIGDVCSYHRISFPLSKKANDRYQRDHYGQLVVEHKVNSQDQVLPDYMESKLQDNFRQSVWYHEDSPKKLRVRLSGLYKYRHKKNLIFLTHPYTVEVTDMVVDPGMAYDEPTTTVRAGLRTGNSYNPETGRYTDPIQNPVGSQRSITSSSRGLPKKRFVEKDYLYTGTEHKVKVSLDLELQSLSPELPLQILHQNSFVVIDIGHEQYEPSIQLNPKEAQYPLPEEVRQDEVNKITHKFLEQLDKRWLAGVSVLSLKGDFFKTGDQVQKYLEVEQEDYPDFIHMWYKNNFGISHLEMNELLQNSQ